jgi:putative chitinase
MLTAVQLKAIAAPKADAANINSVIVALERFGPTVGLDQPHRYAQFGAQLGTESGGFRYDKEIWGPTPAQLRYERDFDHAWPPTKADTKNKLAYQLGNSEHGDGRKFAGKTGLQLTGRGNVTRFYNWCKAKGFNPPNFLDKPELLNSDPWEGLAPIWYWDEGNPTGKSLNVYADEGNIEQITKKINGGLNGYDDRLHCYTALSLAILGYKPGTSGLEEFQAWAQRKGLLPPDTADQKQVDGDAGPKTRSALHQALVLSGKPDKLAEEGAVIKAAPVTQNVAVAPKNAEKINLTRFGAAIGFLGAPIAAFGNLDNTTKLIVVVGSCIAVAAVLWKAEAIARRVRAAAAAFGFSGFTDA